MSRRTLVMAAAACCAFSTAGCVNPDAPQSRPTRESGSRGEPAAPTPRSPTSEASSAAQPTPQKTLERYARLYINWDYRTLTTDQLRLATMSVGAARLTEQKAAAQTRRDATLARARVWNRGAVVAITPDQSATGTWVIVTRERTGGSGEYDALPAGFHVTVARAIQVRGGWAVSAWEPQS